MAQATAYATAVAARATVGRERRMKPSASAVMAPAAAGADGIAGYADSPVE